MFGFSAATSTDAEQTKIAITESSSNRVISSLSKGTQMGCRHPNAGHDCQIPKLTKNPKTTTEVLA
ncbi:MAG: hypothetical protein ABGX07_17170, partial [Pirellulaceae bacterium]